MDPPPTGIKPKILRLRSTTLVKQDQLICIKQNWSKFDAFGRIRHTHYTSIYWSVYHIVKSNDILMRVARARAMRA